MCGEQNQQTSSGYRFALHNLKMLEKTIKKVVLSKSKIDPQSMFKCLNLKNIREHLTAQKYIPQCDFGSDQPGSFQELAQTRHHSQWTEHTAHLVSYIKTCK